MRYNGCVKSGFEVAARDVSQRKIDGVRNRIWRAARQTGYE